MNRDEAVGLLRAWLSAEGDVRVRVEEMIVAAMTADRHAAAFAHRHELNGYVVEYRAPTLEGLAETVKRFHPRPTAWTPKPGDDFTVQDGRSVPASAAEVKAAYEKHYGLDAPTVVEV